MEQAIIVGVDGTSAGRAAVNWAVTRAARQGLPIELVHVVDDEWGAVGERDLFELRPHAAELVDSSFSLATSLAASLGVVVPIHSAILIGDPMVELAQRSRTAAMVVVGTHKTGYFHGRALGSRSLQLAAMAWAPVAVIPESSTSLRKGIIVGLDDTDAGKAAVTFGAAESATSGEPLVFIHAKDGAPRSTPTPSQWSASEVAAAAGVAQPVRTREITRPAAEALIDAALLASVLVIGSSRRRGAELSALGPVSHDVLMNISGPTIVVHGVMAPAASAAG